MTAATSLRVLPLDGKTTVGTYFVSNYPPFAGWSKSALDDVRARLDAPPAPGAPLGVYVHIPFCRKRCRFCYFKVYTERTASEVGAYVEALLADARLHARSPIIAGRKPRFVYFGGGTPSYLSSTELARLLGGLRELMPWDETEEVTFECEPGTISEAKLRVLAGEGVTRLSLGVESFDDAVLEANGRAHQQRQIYQAHEIARRVGLPQINIDLIAGMVGETDAIWDDTVARTIALAPDSVTIYQMELPPNTTIARDLRGADQADTPVDDWPTKRARVGRAFAAMEAAGYRVSSAYTMVKPHARFRYRDNLWTGADLLPVGVSSFGHLGGVHLQNEKEIEVYMARVGAGELPLQRGYVLSTEERLVRELILQLKLGRVRHAYFREKFGVELRERFAEPLGARADAILRDRQHQRRAGVPGPDFGGVDLMPVRKLAALQQEIDRRHPRAAIGSRAIAERFGIMAALGVRLEAEPLDDFAGAMLFEFHQNQ